jgi:hypothetical protein
MTVSIGKIHKYLSITLDYTICGQVKITVFDYVDEILMSLTRQNQRVVALRQVQHLVVFSKWIRVVKILSKTRLLSSTTWYQRQCTLPSEPGHTPAPQSHS